MTTDDAKAPDENQDQLEVLLADAGLNVFPDSIRREVDDILERGQSLEPSARRTFIEAAQRGTRDRGLREHATLETLLFEARRERGREADELVDVVGMDADAIRAIERGDLTIIQPGPEAVASWAALVDIDRQLLAVALERSLFRGGASPVYAADQHRELEPGAETFIAEVLQAYDRLERAEDL